MTMKKKIIQCVETGIVYESVKEASIALNINVKSITMCVNGKRKKAGGYTFITYSNMVTDDSNNKGNANNSNMVTDDSNNKGNANNSNMVTDDSNNKGNANNSNMVTDDSNNNIADTEYLGCLLLVFQAFTAYRNNALKMREEYQKLKAEYEELKSHPHSNEELQAEFDKILEEKRAKFESLVKKYTFLEGECMSAQDKLNEFKKSDEYKKYAERQRKASRLRDKQMFEDDTDGFSSFEDVPMRQTQKHYDDDI